MFRLLERMKGAGSGATLARGSLVVLLTKAGGAASVFVLQLVLARLLGVTDYGVYVYAFSWVLVLTMLSRLGMDMGLTRMVAQYRSSQAWGALRGVLIWAIRNTFFASLTIALIAIYLIYQVLGDVTRNQFITLVIAMHCVPLMSLISLHQGALRALHKVARAEIPESIFRPLLILIMVVTLWLNDIEMGAPAAMAVTFVASIVTLGLVVILLVKSLPDEVFKNGAETYAGEWWSVSLPLMFMQGMYLVLSRMDMLMLGVIIGPDATGVYGAVTRVSDVVIFGLIVVNPVVAPMISELFHSNRREELQRVVTLAARLTSMITAAVAVLLVFFGEWVLGLFGSEFVVGYAALMILLVGQVVNALSGSVGYIMTMTGHQNAAAGILAIIAAGNFVLNYLLIPHFGIEGAAFATAVSIAAWNIAMLVYVRVRIGVRSTVV